MHIVRISLKNYITLFILLSVLLIVGCSSTSQQDQHNTSEKNPAVNETNDTEITNNEEKDEEETANKEEDNVDGTLEVIDGNPIGKYQSNDKTPFMIIKKHPETGGSRPGGFLNDDHPYIKEIHDTLEDLLNALYEIDYKTITDDRHEEFLIGELSEDNTFLNIKGEQGDEVITKIKSIKTTAIDFHDGMEQARVKSEIVYHVLQSKEDGGAFHRYLEGEDYEVTATTEVEKIDDEWKIIHIIDGFAEVIED